MAKQLWLCREKNAHTIVETTGCTSKLLQGEKCQSSIDNKTTQPIMKNMSVVDIVFDIPAFINSVYMYIYSGTKLLFNENLCNMKIL